LIEFKDILVIYKLIILKSKYSSITINFAYIKKVLSRERFVIEQFSSEQVGIELFSTKIFLNNFITH